MRYFITNCSFVCLPRPIIFLHTNFFGSHRNRIRYNPGFPLFLINYSNYFAAFIVSFTDLCIRVGYYSPYTFTLHFSLAFNILLIKIFNYGHDNPKISVLIIIRTHGPIFCIFAPEPHRLNGLNPACCCERVSAPRHDFKRQRILIFIRFFIQANSES